jgi:hypothetical protein
MLFAENIMSQKYADYVALLIASEKIYFYTHEDMAHEIINSKN